MNVDKCHKALLSLADEFRTKTPPDLKSCMQCLLAILNLPVAPHVIAKTNYHLGSLIYRYTFDTNIAQSYLERAYEQTQSVELTPIRLHVVAHLVDIYLSQNQRQLSKSLLTRAINDTTSGGGEDNLYWHYRFLLKLSHLNLEDSEFSNSNNLLSIGAQTAGATNDTFTRLLFLLSKGMVLMVAKKYPNSINQQSQYMNQNSTPEQQLVDTLATAGHLLETLQDDSSRNEALKVFFLVLKVCHHLNRGYNKSARPFLTLLQRSIQNLIDATGPDVLAIQDTDRVSPNMSENFTWLSKEYMRVLVYLISLLHSMQAGFLERAQRYTERALTQIDHMRTQSANPDPLLETFHILLLEHMSMCHLVMGNRVSSIRQTVQAMQLCSRGSTRLKTKHRGIVRTLLGFYAMSMSMMEEAENQFTRVMNDNDTGTELRVMAMLNLALCFLQDESRRHERRNDVEVLLSRLNPEQLNSLSYCLKAAAYYVFGLKAFCDERLHEAKRNLRETLRMANGEDLNRVTSCALVLLGKIFIDLELPAESLSMINSGIHLAGKNLDIHVQLWASSVMREIYARDVNGQHYIEATNMHAGFSNRLNDDKVQSSSLPEHNYIQWFDW